ncbi:MAG: T9SS type A sorting domain-containing protein, partial [Saprospiraceae bacterium]|nr:T9SS type A sorting domain-containing protein [Saprospiraceae bacterium]
VDVPDDACGLPGELPDVTAYDECSGTAPQITLTETIENGPCGSTTVRTWTATDACGNATSESQYFFNEDSEAPQISFNHPDLAGAVDGDLLSFDCIDLNFLATDITATDNCTDDIDIQLDIVLLNSGDCSILGYFEKYNYTWTATDVCGNSTSITLTFETKDIDAPGIFFVPDDLTLYCYEGPLPVADDVAAFDNCSDLEFGMTVDTIVISPIKTIVIRTWKAVDACGNTAVETQTITLLETEISCSFPDAPDYIYCQSFNNTLTVVVEGGFGPYTYDWSLIDCDGIITAGFWTETVTYISGLTPMTFGVTVTDVNGCETYCTITIECMKKYGENSETHFDVAEGSVPETLTLNNGKIKLAPNPANDIIYLGFEGFDRQEKVEVFITNIYGQIIERMVFVEIPVSVLLINTSNYPDGLYSVFVRQENQKPVESKFIVTH